MLNGRVVPASFAPFLRRTVPLCLLLAVATAGRAADGVISDVRRFGAVGDGQLHRVSEWIDAGRFRNLRALQKQFPFVDSTDWSIDEVAFVLAKESLPPEGGTIHFPAGHYVSGRYPWRIWRSHVRLTGDGADRTTLSTAPGIDDGLSVAPYRHAGWREGANREYPFSGDSGRAGDRRIRLTRAEWTDEFKPGELVFVRNGANRFDQDYGEFNEVEAVESGGILRLKHALARDYTLESVNWAAEVAEAFQLPKPNGEVDVKIRTGEGFFTPPERCVVSIGENIFRVKKAWRDTLILQNRGRANAPRGTVIPTGEKIAKSRTILKLTRSTRDFRCENLTIVGRRKAVNISNSYEVSFADCVFIRDLREGGFTGGLTIDGDGGRFARFDRCEVIARPAVGMQFARSFGDVEFIACRFRDTNVAFTEFNFACTVVDSDFDVTGTPALQNVAIVGGSCGDLRLEGNRIKARGVRAIFDAVSDIHSQKHGSGGQVILRGNRIETEKATQVFPDAPPGRFVLEKNHVQAD